ncbi:hypothetical protein VFPPC_17697 [Pochonia chlamydosporia 170]|uniref:Uncharacterized protein n=1 Tax=Pochonia chlamydosporia 170 TaxID=1380566 RepID=A0A219AQS1_METCM|nr:hypothetical protein VFPPC_17697 [Pochonia chlamydosporia 170]OWT43127.1 hypothetical protein VFPPC_17697 [Pochonia chlamydosporia 170]
MQYRSPCSIRPTWTWTWTLTWGPGRLGHDKATWMNLDGMVLCMVFTARAFNPYLSFLTISREQILPIAYNLPNSSFSGTFFAVVVLVLRYCRNARYKPADQQH